MMKVRLEALLTASDGERSVVRTVEMPAPPMLGLMLVGPGWRVEVERVSYSLDSGEYRASCRSATAETTAIADVVRLFEIDGWRVAAAKEVIEPR